jgi:hypothetical protein
MCIGCNFPQNLCLHYADTHAAPHFSSLNNPDDEPLPPCVIAQTARNRYPSLHNPHPHHSRLRIINHFECSTRLKDAQPHLEKALTNLSQWRVVFTFGWVLFTCGRVLFTFGRVLFNFGRVLFTFGRLLYTFGRVLFTLRVCFWWYSYMVLQLDPQTNPGVEDLQK